MSETLKDLRKEITRLESTLDRVKIELDSVCKAMASKDAEIERISGRADELQEQCDYFKEVQ